MGRVPSAEKPKAKSNWVSTSAIYNMQTRIFFGTLLRATSLSYDDDKDALLDLFASIIKRRASWSRLTLGERNQLIEALADKWLGPGSAVTVPLVPKRLRAWQKGDPANGYERKDIPAHDLQRRYILKLWGLLGYEPNHLDTRVQRQFGVERFEWLTDPEALKALVQDLWARCDRQGIDPEPA